MPVGVVWSPQEDDKLRSLVKEYGDKKWSLISTKLGTKESKQCRRRWKNCLSLDVKKGSWSAEEDSVLRRLHADHGNRWTMIARLVGGRTDNAVKNRWAALLRRKNSTGRRGRRPSAHTRLRGMQKDYAMLPAGHRRRGRRPKVQTTCPSVKEEPVPGGPGADQALINVPPNMVLDGIADHAGGLGVDQVPDLDNLFFESYMGQMSGPNTDALSLSSPLPYPMGDGAPSDFNATSLSLGAQPILDCPIDIPASASASIGMDWLSDHFATSPANSRPLARSQTCPPLLAGQYELDSPMRTAVNAGDETGPKLAPAGDGHSPLPCFTHSELDMLITALQIT